MNLEDAKQAATKAKLRELAEHLRKVDAAPTKVGKRLVGFDLGVWADDGDGQVFDKRGHLCNTVACIAGHCMAYFKPQVFARKVNNATEDDFEDQARDLLGLDGTTAFALFTPNHGCKFSPEYGATAAEAAKVLDHLAETGEVDWSVAFT